MSHIKIGKLFCPLFGFNAFLLRVGFDAITFSLVSCYLPPCFFSSSVHQLAQEQNNFATSKKLSRTWPIDQSRKESRLYFCNNLSLQFAILIFSWYKTRVRIQWTETKLTEMQNWIEDFVYLGYSKNSNTTFSVFFFANLIFYPSSQFFIIFFSSSKQKIRIFIPTVKLNRYWSILWGSSTHLCKGNDPRSSQDRKWNIHIYTFPFLAICCW